MYIKYGLIKGFRHEVLTSENGHVIIKFVGKGVWDAFSNEIGKHVVQRVPPTETRGRRQTSVISVAVLPLPPVEKKDELKENDLEIIFQTGHQKAGGQNVNRVKSACRMIHRPTGLCVFINGRDQGQNRKEALQILTARVREHYQNKENVAYNSQRKQQMDGGGRGNKIRTYNFINTRIVDHRLGVKTRNIKEFMKGNFSVLFDQGEKGE